MFGRNYDVIEAASGNVVRSVRHLFAEQPVDCCMCGQPTFSRLCVPFYERAVREGRSDGGYATACDPCYGRWEVWNDRKSLAARRKPAHGGYPAPAPKPEPVALMHVQPGAQPDTLFYQLFVAPGHHGSAAAAHPQQGAA
ncbi:hypothetical protein [Ramlibacter sp. AN1133]|uniref:hypothetical protein n=1 Tax=Ramlibacter sp. AN1133 TaxID=3133429 RepID=UPI0030C1EEE7